MNKPYFTELDFKIKGCIYTSRLTCSEIANAKIQPLLDKLKRYEKALKEIHSLPIGAFDMSTTSFNKFVTKQSFKIASEALSKTALERAH